MESIILLASGILGGFIAGLLGVGGGIFYILILPYAMQWYGVPEDVNAAFVVANSLFGIAFASGTSLLVDFNRIKKHLKEAIILGIPAVLFSVLSTKFIVHSQWFSKEIFNVFVIFLMLFILSQMLFSPKVTAKDKSLPIMPSIFSGGLAGSISAMSGLGGGIIVIPLLQIGFKQSIAKAKLISLFIIFVSSSFMSIQNLFSQAPSVDQLNYQWGYIIPIISIPVMIGTFIGSPLGIKLSKNMNDKYLNIFFLAFVIIVLIEKLLVFI